MTAPTHIVCEICRKPVKVIRHHDQRAARLADHGPQVAVLCAGAGLPVLTGAEK